MRAAEALQGLGTDDITDDCEATVPKKIKDNLAQALRAGRQHSRLHGSPRLRHLLRVDLDGLLRHHGGRIQYGAGVATYAQSEVEIWSEEEGAEGREHLRARAERGLPFLWIIASDRADEVPLQLGTPSHPLARTCTHGHAVLHNLSGLAPGPSTRPDVAKALFAHVGSPSEEIYPALDEDDEDDSDTEEDDLGKDNSVNDPQPVLEADRHLIDKLHRNLGHPPTDRFLRALRAMGARAAVLKYVKDEYHCEECQARRGAQPRRMATLPRTFTFNYILGVDLFSLRWVTTSSPTSTSSTTGPTTSVA